MWLPAEGISTDDTTGVVAKIDLLEHALQATYSSVSSIDSTTDGGKDAPEANDEINVDCA